MGSPYIWPEAMWSQTPAQRLFYLHPHIRTLLHVRLWSDLKSGAAPPRCLSHTHEQCTTHNSGPACVEINVTSSPHPQHKKIQFSFTFIPETNVTVKDDTTTRDQATLFACVPVCVCFSCSEIVNSFKVMYCCLYLQSHSRPQWCCSCSSMTSCWPLLSLHSLPHVFQYLSFPPHTLPLFSFFCFILKLLSTSYVSLLSVSCSGTKLV